MKLTQQLKEKIDKSTDREINPYIKRLIEKENILKSQIQRFHDNYDFETVIEKVHKKYSSDEYRDKWFNIGIEPPQPLYDFLFEYVRIYGRDATSEEFELYGNDFTGALKIYKGWVFNLMIGQGSCLIVSKI